MGKKKEMWKNWLIGMLVLIVIVESLALFGVFGKEVMLSPGGPSGVPWTEEQWVDYYVQTSSLENLKEFLQDKYNSLAPLYEWRDRIEESIRSLGYSVEDGTYTGSVQDYQFLLNQYQSTLEGVEWQIEINQFWIRVYESAIEIKEEQESTAGYVNNPPGGEEYNPESGENSLSNYADYDGSYEDYA